MAQPCKVCNHPERLEIDRGLLEGRSKAALARAFAVPADCVERHARKHVQAALAKATEGREALYGNRLVDHVIALQERTQAILDGAAKDPTLALKAIASARSNLELMARLHGQLKDRTVNQALVIVDPETAERMAKTFLSRRSERPLLVENQQPASKSLPTSTLPEVSVEVSVKDSE